MRRSSDASAGGSLAAIRKSPDLLVGRRVARYARLVTIRRSQESQALTQSRAIMQVDIRTMTDWISDDTVRRFNINWPPELSAT